MVSSFPSPGSNSNLDELSPWPTSHSSEGQPWPRTEQKHVPVLAVLKHHFAAGWPGPHVGGNQKPLQHCYPLDFPLSGGEQEGEGGEVERHHLMMLTDQPTGLV